LEGNRPLASCQVKIFVFKGILAFQIGSVSGTTGALHSSKYKDLVENVPFVGDIPNRYTSDVVLNQQARVAHQGWYGGFTIPGGPVAGVAMMVLDGGAYGGSLDRPMADY
jgi:hypothetical protein